MQDKRSKGYLFRTRKSSGGQVRNRKGGYLFRTRKDGGEFHKRAEYLFRTRRTPYTAGKRQGSYLLRTRGGYLIDVLCLLALFMSQDEKFPGKLCINCSINGSGKLIA